jgi:hypothetical protein
LLRQRGDQRRSSGEARALRSGATDNPEHIDFEEALVSRRRGEKAHRSAQRPARKRPAKGHPNLLERIRRSKKLRVFGAVAGGFAVFASNASQAADNVSKIVAGPTESPSEDLHGQVNRDRDDAAGSTPAETLAKILACLHDSQVAVWAKQRN